MSIYRQLVSKYRKEKKSKLGVAHFFSNAQICSFFLLLSQCLFSDGMHCNVSQLMIFAYRENQHEFNSKAITRHSKAVYNITEFYYLTIWNECAQNQHKINQMDGDLNSND